MTNREWLATLTDEEFADWALFDPVPFSFRKNEEGKYVLDSKPDKVYPRLNELRRRYTSSFQGLIEWLGQEYVPFEIAGGE